MRRATLFAFDGVTLVDETLPEQPSSLREEIWEPRPVKEGRIDFTTDAGILSYLDKRTFEAGDVWFKEEFYKGGIVNATSRHPSPKRGEA